jgi:hypothetical protein
MTFCRIERRHRPACSIARMGTVCSLLLASAVTAAAGDLPEIVDVKLGFSGTYKVGHWTPAAVTLQGGGDPVVGRVVVAALDGDAVPARTKWQDQPPRTVPAAETTVVHTIFKPGRLRGPLRVDFVTTDGRRVSRRYAAVDLPEAAPATRELILALGDDLGLADLLSARQVDPDEASVLAHVTVADDLPDVWWGYAGVDTVTLTTGANDLCNRMTDRQIAALHDWVLLGGRLILSAAARGDELLGADGRWHRFLSARFERLSTLRETTGLEAAAKAGRLDQSAGGERVDISVSVLSEIEGRVEFYEGSRQSGRPIAIRAAYGLGRVVFVCVDLDRPPIAGWEGRSRLVARLLSRPAAARRIDPDELSGGRASHIGYKDLMGQLRAALDQFTGVRVIPFSLIAGLVVVYIALIGPLDYFFLRRFVGRMEWTWLTFSLIAVVFCGLAWWLVQVSKGSQRRVNQVTLVDVDMQRRVVRGTVWAHVYTPRAERLNLSLRVLPATDVRGNPASAQGQGRGGTGRGELLSWFGLPGTALGGMGTATRTDRLAGTYALLADRQEDLVPRMTIQGMPMNAASSRSLIGRWWGSFEDSSTLVRQQRRGSEPRVVTTRRAGSEVAQSWPPLPRILRENGCFLDNAGREVFGGEGWGEGEEAGSISPLTLTLSPTNPRQFSTGWQIFGADSRGRGDKSATSRSVSEDAAGSSYAYTLGYAPRQSGVSQLKTDAAGLLVGRITNPLPVDLTESMVFYDRWAYSLGRLAAGQSAVLEESLAPRNVETLLRRRRVEDMKDVTTPWDRSSVDVPRILQMMMFHEIAGGRSYTGLLHRHEGKIDLSDHLRLGRAVLVGRSDEPAAELAWEDGAARDRSADRQWTYYRVVFPVNDSSNPPGDDDRD